MYGNLETIYMNIVFFDGNNFTFFSPQPSLMYSFALYDFNKNLKGPSCVSGFTGNIYTFSKTFPEPHGQPSLSRPFQL